MKKERRNTSHSGLSANAEETHDREHGTTGHSSQIQIPNYPKLDREIETILDPSWAWRMLHKP